MARGSPEHERNLIACMKRTSRFSRGSGRFKCAACEKLTRNTGDNGSVEMCPVCTAKAECGNGLSDYTTLENPWGQFDGLETVEAVEQRYRELLDANRVT